jgi:hypothetical protein
MDNACYSQDSVQSLLPGRKWCNLHLPVGYQQPLGTITVGGQIVSGLTWKAVKTNGVSLAQGTTTSNTLKAAIGNGAIFRLETTYNGVVYKGNWACTPVWEYTSTGSSCTKCQQGTTACGVCVSRGYTYLQSQGKTANPYDGSSGTIASSISNIVIP